MSAGDVIATGLDTEGQEFALSVAREAVAAYVFIKLTSVAGLTAL